MTVQFDHMSEPYNVEMVKSRFVVMKNFYVYRKQYPLILAYAETIHKCQGLSLNCAIIDLSDEVFGAGMAYVALSRVRSLSGLYLSAFDPKSIIVSPTCLKEVNRLRETFRNDLPLYNIPLKASAMGTKRKLTGATHHDGPKQKRSKQDPHTLSNTLKRKRPCTTEDQKPAKRMCCGGEGSPRQSEVNPLKFHPVNEQWQRSVCAIMGLQYNGKNRLRSGGPKCAPDTSRHAHC